MAAKRRIAVTGIGVVSCLGNDVDAFYEDLLLGKSGAETISKFSVDEYDTKFAACIKNFDPGTYMEKKQARRVDPFIAYGIVAAKKALEYGGIGSDVIASFDKKRCGVILGSGMGGMEVFSDNISVLKEKGPSRVTPFLIPYIISNMAGALIGIDFGFMGPNYSISTACATGNNCIIAAAEHIRRGDADFMITGGTEGAVIPIALAGFSACKALSKRNDAPQKASRPWDKGRDGFLMGEGAGVLILEEWEHAKKRGAKILAEYLGGGISCDAYHMTEPRDDGEGVAECIRLALEDAGIKAEDVDYINAHATSTPLGDMAEINALKKIFKDPSKVAINGTKSMIGHSLGAAGGIEGVVTVKALMEGELHPTINLENKEEGVTFFTPTVRTKRDIKIAMSNSFGFGGHNATIVLKKV